MSASIRRLLGYQAVGDEEQARVAWLLNTFLLFFLAGSLLITLTAAIFYLFQPDPETIFTLLSGVIMTLCFAGLLFLARRGYLRLASVLLLSVTWVLASVWIFAVSGISSDSSTLVYALLVVLAGLLLGGRAAMVVALASVLAVVGAYWAEVSGLLTVLDRAVGFADVLFVSIPLILTGVLLRYAMRSITQAIEHARRNEQAQIEANRQLQLLRESLEQRVADRTSELERRSKQLQAATEVGQAATSILDVDRLIWQVVQLIQHRFDLHHVGLFVVDELGEWAIYRAGAGESARELSEQGFRLRVGGESMVGWCTANNQVRIAQDVEKEPMRLDHHLVPKTRSEAALPLAVRGQVLAAISVHSSQIGAFDDASVAALQTMADQIAVALDNARLFAELQQTLEMSRRAYGQMSRQAWADLLHSRPEWGYRYVQGAVVRADGDWTPQMLTALQSAQPVVQQPQAINGEHPTVGEGGVGQDGSALALPLRVRDDVIGVLSFSKESEDGVWTSEQIEMLQRLVDQLGAALESAQLYRDTQRRAAREQAIRQVTEQVRRAVDVEQILRNAVSELARAMGAPRAYVRLGTEAELLAGHTMKADDGSGDAEAIVEKPESSVPSKDGG
jgi:GAF domain-containing protein